MTNLELYRKWKEMGGESSITGWIHPLEFIRAYPKYTSDLELLEGIINSGFCDSRDWECVGEQP